MLAKGYFEKAIELFHWAYGRRGRVIRAWSWEDNPRSLNLFGDRSLPKMGDILLSPMILH